MSYKIISLALGVRFRANFKIEDRLGEIVDGILYKKDSYFNPHFFPMTRNQVNEKVLYNEETGNYLLVNNSSIIGEFSSRDGEVDVYSLTKRFGIDILDNLISNYKLSSIYRIGYLLRVKITNKQALANLIKRDTGMSIKDIGEYSTTFSLTKSLKESMAKRAIYDFLTIIYNISREHGTDALILSIDYQKNYKPFADHFDELKYEQFAKDAHSYILTEINKYNDIGNISNVGWEKY